MVTSLAAITLMGFATLGIGLAPSSFFPLALGAMALTGVAQSMANGPIGAALQASVPPELQGRVFTLTSAASAAMMPLGLALAGPLSDIVGPGLWFLLSGAACLLLGVGGLFVPSIVRLEEDGAALASRTAASIRAEAERTSWGSDRPVNQGTRFEHVSVPLDDAASSRKEESWAFSVGITGR